MIRASRFITHCIAKSKTRNMHDKDAPKGGSVYGKQGVPLDFCKTKSSISETDVQKEKRIRFIHVLLNQERVLAFCFWN